jgi:ribose transport system ATP-binding protein
VSIGDATVGGNFTLLAIAAPVLGGASLLGGRGSFIGCLVGAIVLALTQALPQILGISDATGYLLTGVLTLAALLAYSSRRGPRRSPPAVVGPVPAAESLDDHDEESPCA